MPRQRGFTLIEVLVAVTIMAVLAVLSWRGLDGMAKAHAQARIRGDEVLALQAGLSQWGADLDAITRRDATTPIEWDGRVLRLTRSSSGDASEGLRVAAWSRRTLADGNSWWLRWESGPLVSLAQWNQAWGQAALWAQNPGDAERSREVAVARADNWQIFYYRNNAWSNPLSSSDAATSTSTSTGTGTGTAQTIESAAAPTLASVTTPPVEGVRLLLSLSAGQAFAGTLTRDWVSPQVIGSQP